MKMTWRSQLANGRVFELRSKSKRYPAPCALVIDNKAMGWGARIFAAVDSHGCFGHGSHRRHNPGIYIEGLRRDEFTGSRVRCRRFDLERFDADDLALIRYGLTLDFTGRIEGAYSNISMDIPVIVPAEWTVFWLPAWDADDYRWLHIEPREELRQLFSGAWHLESYGGCRHLGYGFGHAWATRHSGSRLNQIRQFLRSRLGGLIEQHVKVMRWSEGENVFTEEIRRDCPALGSRACLVQTPNGTQGIYR